MNTPEARKRRRGLLRFSIAEGRLTGMPVLALLYPSLYLARACDPAKLLAERAQERSADDGPPSVETTHLEHVLAIARERISVGLDRLSASPTDGVVDERWYWAAPLLLDRLLDVTATMAWFDQPDLAAAWAGEDTADDTGSSADDEDAPTPAGATLSEDDGDAWQKHVEEARLIAHSGAGTALGTTNAPLGRRPDDLIDVLAGA